MSKSARVAVLIVSLLAVLAPSAHAVTWHNSGDTAFTATTILPGFGTLSATGVALQCTGWSITGTTGAAPFVGSTWTAAQVTSRYTGCILAGIATTLHCRQTFTAESQSGAVTSGSMDTLCEAYMFNTQVCKVEGVQAASYTNPSGAPGFFTLPLTTGLRSTAGAGGSCPWGDNDVMTWTARTLTIAAATGGPAPHTGPVIARTA